MRSEKRNRFFAVLMALVLLVSVPVVCLRVQMAGFQLTSGDLEALVEYNNAYLDCTGAVITDQETPVPDALGNLIGVDNYVTNSLVSGYKSQMGPDSFNRLTGIRSLKNLQGSRMETTLLPLSSQEAMVEIFRNADGELDNGAVFAYNYQTGQVYAALSLPSAGSFGEDLPEGALFNKVLKGTYVPGSTMKIVALVCALEQNAVAPGDITFDCDGQTVAPDGNEIVCSYAHGEDLSIQDAIGLSCNGFITEMAGKFDVEQACESLHRMGFGTQQQDVQRQYIGKLQRSSSSTVFADPEAFADRWGFAGQGLTAVSCVDMAMIAGAIANGGKAAEPYLVQRIVDLDSEKVTGEAETRQRELFSETVAAQADTWWTEACQTYYNLPRDVLSYAKTGTAQVGNGTINRALVGVMKEYDTAFFIYLEDVKSGDNRCTKIAAVLADELAKINGKD